MHPLGIGYTFFLSTHGTFVKIDHKWIKMKVFK